MGRRVRVDTVHLSGRYDATDREWMKALDYLASEGDVISLTECRNVGAVPAWAGIHGWTMARPQGAECAWLAAPGIRVDRVRGPRLSEQRLASGKVVRATTARFKIDGRPRWWGSAAHLPSSVEGRGRLARGRQATVHALAVAGWKASLVGKGPRRHLVADFNLNYRLGWVREWAAAHFRRAVSGWRGKLPKAGTFRGRLIDWVLVGRGLKAGKSRPLRRLDGFDHRPFKTTLHV